MANYSKLMTHLKSLLLGKKYYLALKALNFARQYHTGLRKDGVTPEFEHQVKICLYILTLKDLENEELAVTVAILHDVMEDYEISFEEMEAKFGKEVTRSVWLMTKKYKGEKKTSEEYFTSLAKDSTASIVKGSDRIHNLQSMQGAFKKEKQLAYIKEVEEYFLPMLKSARDNYPEQSAAYFNIGQTLKSQMELIKAIHDNNDKA